MAPSNHLLSAGTRDWRLVVTLALIFASAVGLNALSHGAPVTLPQSLAEFPRTLDAWQGADLPIDARVVEELGATDLINREYRDARTNHSLGLFVAFFSSQQKGGTIHSPKNCLPGAGWSVVEGSTIPISVPGHAETLMVNQYVIQKDQNKQVVLYWYQSQGRVIASEYSAKFYLMWDALRNNRSDGALVRIVSPVRNGDQRAALEQAVAFAQESFPQLNRYLPN